MKKTLGFLAMLLATPAAAQSYDSDAIPQFLKAGPQCSAFYMAGPNHVDGSAGTWYAINTGAELAFTQAKNIPGDPTNNANQRWAQVAAVWSTGKALWVTSPATVSITTAPNLVQCSVPGQHGGMYPNAIIYSNPDQPGE